MVSQSSSSTSRPPPHDQQLLVTWVRPRANTADLQCPRPELHPNGYTDDRIRPGLAYAERRLRSKTRKPSPVLQKLLMIYQGACFEILQRGDSEEKPIHIISEIRNYEIQLTEKTWAWTASDDKTQTIQDSLITLRLQFHARYGDYAKRLAHMVRKCSIIQSRTLEIIVWPIQIYRD